MTGDDAAFGELVRRRQGAVRGLLRGMAASASTADDLAQEAFVLAWRRIHTLRTPAAFSGWLRQIAVNVFLRHIRRTEAAHESSLLRKERRRSCCRRSARCSRSSLVLRSWRCGAAEGDYFIVGMLKSAPPDEPPPPGQRAVTVFRRV